MGITRSVVFENPQESEHSPKGLDASDFPDCALPPMLLQIALDQSLDLLRRYGIDPSSSLPNLSYHCFPSQPHLLLMLILESDRMISRFHQQFGSVLCEIGSDLARLYVLWLAAFGLPLRFNSFAGEPTSPGHHIRLHWGLRFGRRPSTIKLNRHGINLVSMI